MLWLIPCARSGITHCLLATKARKLDLQRMLPFEGRKYHAQNNRVRTGHGKPGKSWNFIVGYGKAWKIIVCVVRKLLQVSISKDKIK